ncbi:AI-2E family transporter [Liberibacter sp. Z1]|nr:AI-2E family transporter [Candidatus Liberibacter sp.]
MQWAVLCLGLISVYFFKGFLVPVLAALIIGSASWPLYSFFLKKNKVSPVFLAILATILVFFVLIIPLVVVTSYASLQLHDLISTIDLSDGKAIPMPLWLSALPDPFGAFFIEHWKSIETFFDPQNTRKNVELILKSFIFLSRHLFDWFLSAIFMLIALFFVFLDGRSMYRQLDIVGEHFFPKYWKKLSRIIPKIIRSTFLGMTIIAIGEGVSLGIAYWIAGVPSHIAMGILTAFMATIPGGAPLACILVSLYLLLIKANTFNAIALFVWGAFELFIVDKTLRPFLIGGPIKLPFLPTFFGLIGGVKTMGLLGLFIGPVIMALIVEIWKECIQILRERKSIKEEDSL